MPTNSRWDLIQRLKSLKDFRKQSFPIDLLTMDKFTGKGKGKAIPVTGLERP